MRTGGDTVTVREPVSTDVKLRSRGLEDSG